MRTSFVEHENIVPERQKHTTPNRYLVERLLDGGHPIAINALEHSRVAIGYNETHLLFADSWDTKYYESNGTGTDVTNAGFSVVDKWLIYTWMRDIAYVEMREFEIDNSVVRSNPNRSHVIRTNKSRRKSSRRRSSTTTAKRRTSTTKRSSKRIRKSNDDDDDIVDLTTTITTTKNHTTKKDDENEVVDLTNDDDDFSSWMARDEFEEEEEYD